MFIDFSKLTLKELLLKLLPPIVWVGYEKTRSQPAYLIDQETHFEYVMSNEPIQGAPQTAIFFNKIEECNAWIEEIVSSAKIIDTKIETLQQLIKLEEIINQYFRYNFFATESMTNQKVYFKHQDIHENLTEISADIDREISTQCEYLLDFFNENQLYQYFEPNFDIKKITWTDVESAISKFYDEKYDDISFNIIQILKQTTVNISKNSYKDIADLCDQPLIAVIKLKDHLEKELAQLRQLEAHRKKMRDHWANF